MTTAPLSGDFAFPLFAELKRREIDLFRASVLSCLQPDEDFIDNFCGAGGWDAAAKRLGMRVAAASNHSKLAVRIHTANFPDCEHYEDDIWDIDPRKVRPGRKIGCLANSPDCRHFSRARGKAPVLKRVRDLAWNTIKWAKLRRPRVIWLENVPEFLSWGPVRLHIDEDGRPIRDKKGRLQFMPIPEKAGQTFKRWATLLRKQGYAVEWRVLEAADYGNYSRRKRLFLCARCDGMPIIWPEPTHASPKKLARMPLDVRALYKPHRPAHEIIDWSLPVPSIFDRDEPLEEKTERRIALGLMREIVTSPRPFIVNTAHGGEHFRGQSLDRPLSTVTKQNGYALVTTMLAKYVALGGAIIGAGGAGYAGKPVGLDQPLGTVIRHDRRALTTAYMIRMNHGDKQWSSLFDPLSTVTSQGNKAGLVYAFMMKYHGSGGQWSNLHDPLGALTTRDRCGLVTVHIDGDLWFIADIGMRMLQPHELAAAMGFPPTFIWPKAKNKATHLIGNAVAVPMAEALLRAAFPGGVKPERAVA